MLGGLLSSKSAESHGGRLVDDILVVVKHRAQVDKDGKGRRVLIDAAMRAFVLRIVGFEM